MLSSLCLLRVYYLFLFFMAFTDGRLEFLYFFFLP